MTGVRRRVLCGVLALGWLHVAASLAAAQDRYAVLIFGAPGGDPYVQTYARWEAVVVQALQGRLGFDPAHVLVLSGAASDPERRSTADIVRRTFERLRSTVGRDDLLLVLLVGHGSAEGPSAKFNLVGPDLDASEWAMLFRGMAARVIFINSAGASFPFLEQLSERNRIVITATDSSAQRFDTVFPDLLVKALDDPATDLDRNGRLSLWEVFSQTSAAVRQYYEQRGQLATERALLDDNGDRAGLEAGAPGMDGALARTTYLDADMAASTDDPEVAALLARQRALEEEAESLKLRKGTMPLGEWNQEFEKLMIELARVSRAIRQRS
jgi:hypothetical protein